MNTKSSMVDQLRDREYRSEFVASQIRIGLPMQCRALRESREMTQPALAEAAGMSQPRISEIERPGERKLNLETLLRLASAFDVGLQVRFVPFSKLIDDEDAVDLDNFYVSPFEEDMARLARMEEKMKSVTSIFSGSALEGEMEAGKQHFFGLAEQAATPRSAGRSDLESFSRIAS